MGLDDGSLMLVNVWIISDEDMGQMIAKVLKPEDLEHTMAIILPEMEQPWDLLDNCQRWMDVLKRGVFELTPKLDLKLMQRLRERNEILYKTYQEPEFDEEGNLKSRRKKLNINTEQADDPANQSSPKFDEIEVQLMED